MAPLMATVAASLAVGVGVSLTRIARDRRSKRARRLGLAGGESPGSALQRMALGQLDLALESLQSGGGVPEEEAIHETRKALKRLRGLLRLLESQLGARVYERESRALRDAGRALAGARDAEVMLATLDALVEHHRGKLAGRGGVTRLRGALLRELAEAREQALEDPRVRAQVVAELAACRVRVRGWSLPGEKGLELVESDLAHLYRQGGKRGRRARDAKSSQRVRAMHQWRKRVKDLRYAAEMLEPPERPKSERPKRRRARRRYEQGRRDARWLRRVGKRADRLGETLGEDHDLAVLAQRIEEDGSKGFASDARLGRSRRLLLKLISRKRRGLRKEALRQGERLFGPSPKSFLSRIRSAHGEGV